MEHHAAPREQSRPMGCVTPNNRVEAKMGTVCFAKQTGHKPLTPDPVAARFTRENSNMNKHGAGDPFISIGLFPVSILNILAAAVEPEEGFDD